jgi:hypothetical protein
MGTDCQPLLRHITGTLKRVVEPAGEVGISG